MTTTERRLYLYLRLLDNQIVSKQELVNKFKVTPRAIQRDISQLRQTIAELQLPQEIVYLPQERGFCLNSEQHQLNRQEILVIIKTLLASRSLNSAEMAATIDGLLGLIHSDDRAQIEPLIKNERFFYQPLQHQRPLLDKIWALSHCIATKQTLQIDYQRQHAEHITRQILPQALIFSEFYFYLISYSPKHNSSLLYRVDRISDYQVLGHQIQRDYKDRFQEGVFRQKIQFMYPGQPIQVKFRFWGIVEAALDRLPTGKIIAAFAADSQPEAISPQLQPSRNGSVIISAEVYGERGILMWFLSQGAKVQVLAPTTLVTQLQTELTKIQARYQPEATH
ncbi:helix-turn-helix transcriptional regulator [Lapidilactobacillus luobeiensis]|uniref:helix-turn-helix transcriptional regulator n=1 Tax=Lapidilactobacillus luobeiensis TaxID=2950371 RepID=UPI0021C4792C|nr:WYL domain-containing protein [Lapidilactobacillus luobeiensis]